jgi:hypothetical protein
MGRTGVNPARHARLRLRVAPRRSAAPSAGFDTGAFHGAFEASGRGTSVPRPLRGCSITSGGSNKGHKYGPDEVAG